VILYFSKSYSSRNQSTIFTSFLFGTLSLLIRAYYLHKNPSVQVIE